MDSLIFPNNLLKYQTFWPIVDPTNSLHHGVCKFLRNLFNPITQNENTVNDLVEAVKIIHKISTDVFDHDYWYFSFELISFVFKCSSELNY